MYCIHLPPKYLPCNELTDATAAAIVGHLT